MIIRKYKKYRLQLLAVLTGFGLLGIIILQAYWLTTSFKQQRVRFKDDVENALTIAMIKSQLLSVRKNVIGTNNNSFQDSIVAELLSSMTNFGNKISNLEGASIVIEPNEKDQNSLDSATPTTKIFYRSPTSENFKAIPDTIPSTNISATWLENLKKVAEEELQRKEIYLPLELAINNEKNNELIATCSRKDFQNLPAKYDISNIAATIFGKNVQIKAAFPNANLFLLRKMAMILIVSILLMVVCVFSFYFMTRQFFKQKKLAEIRNDFMNNMTHELKTPISSVSVALEMLHKKGATMGAEKANEYFSLAQGELQRLYMLVEKVLKIASFEKSETHLSIQIINATNWINETIASMNPILEKSAVKIITTVDPTSFLLNADKTHLTNVLQNLIENAIKYNDKKTVLITIEFLKHLDEVTLIVKDNGMGIPAAYLPKVFDKFFRVPSGNLHNVKGYGLGLSYVKAITDLHFGTISVKSILGTGSTFTIKLPQP